MASTGGSAYTGAECVFWKVGTWGRGPSIPLERTTSPSHLAFSDDGHMLAVARTMTELSLLDPRDLQELARLHAAGIDDPEPLAIQPRRRLPGGRYDLRLYPCLGFTADPCSPEEMRLDWDLPHSAPRRVYRRGASP